MAKEMLTNAINAVLNDPKSRTSKIDGTKFLASDGTPMRVRSMDSDYDPLEVGDILNIPNDFQLLGMRFTDKEDEVPKSFFFVEVTLKDGGSRPWRFFPNSLCKARRPYEKGKVLAKVKTSGSASEEYRKHAFVDDAIDALKGKRILVADAQLVTVRERNGEVKDTHIYKYDFVE